MAPARALHIAANGPLHHSRGPAQETVQILQFKRWAALMRYRLSIVLLSVVAAGCVPLPHSLYLAPAIEGIVTSNGAPVQNAEISVSTRDGDDRQKSATDRDGRFIVKPIRKTKLLFPFPPGDQLISYSITINIAEKHYAGLNEFFVGCGPKKISVTCELSKPVQSQQEAQYCVSNSHE